MPADKPLPHNLDAERSVLGAILLDNKYLAPAAEQLTPSDFFLRDHQILFTEMLAMHEAATAIDLVTLSESLQSHGKMPPPPYGSAYIASLTDGLPRVLNLTHYAQIVHEKALIRRIIHQAANLQEKAWTGLTSPADLAIDLELMAKASSNGHGRARVAPIALTDFLQMELKPAEFVIDPILPSQGMALIYAWRGSGKTFFNLEIAVAIATGGPKLFNWNIPRARRVLYVDGEMPANELQDRLNGIVLGRGMRLPTMKRHFEIFTPDKCEGVSLNIVSAAGQRLIEDHLEGDDVVFFDNLSALGHANDSKESEAESWWPVQEWALRLRKKGITMIFLHHAGKKGEQRGTSSREDLMHTVIAMRRPADYEQHEGLRTEIHFEKLRKYMGAESVYPFELTMQTDQRGAVLWLQRPLKDIIEDRAREMFAKGMKVNEIAEDLHLSRFQVYRLKQKLSQ